MKFGLTVHFSTTIENVNSEESQGSSDLFFKDIRIPFTATYQRASVLESNKARLKSQFYFLTNCFISPNFYFFVKWFTISNCNNVCKT